MCVGGGMISADYDPGAGVESQRSALLVAISALPCSLPSVVKDSLEQHDVCVVCCLTVLL